MRTKRSLIIILVLLLTAFLTACGGSAEPEAPTAPETNPPESEATTAPETNPSESEAATAEPAEGAASGSGLNGTHTFVVAAEGSQASFIVNEEFFADAFAKYGIEAGKNVVVGTTPGVTGEIQLDFDSADPMQSAQFTVDMTGLQTDRNQRDKWLKDNAIETNAFPESTFTATSVTGLPETIQEGEEVNFQLNGDLTVRDVTRNVTWNVTAVISGSTLEGTATLGLNITDFGIAPPDFANTLTVSDPFTIEVQITATES